MTAEGGQDVPGEQLLDPADGVGGEVAADGADEPVDHHVARKKWRAPLICCAAFLILCVVGALVAFPVAKSIMEGKFASAPLEVLNIRVLADPSMPAVTLKVSTKVFVPADAMAAPLGFTGFHCRVEPTAFALSLADEDLPQPLFLGELEAEAMEAAGGQDFSPVLNGVFRMVDQANTQTAFQRAFANKTMTMKMDGSANVHVTVFGFISLSFSDVKVARSHVLAAFNHFGMGSNISSYKSVTPVGIDRVNVAAAGSVYNPTVIDAIVSDDSLMLDLYYPANCTGDSKHHIGSMEVANPSLTTGISSVDGVAKFHKTPQNTVVFLEMTAAYIGSDHRGYDKIGTRPLSVGVKCNGACARTPALAVALQGMQLPLSIAPPPCILIARSAAYVKFFAGLFKPVEATITLFVNNPFPTEVKISSASLGVYLGNLKGPKVYAFHHPFPTAIVLPPGPSTEPVACSMELLTSEVEWAQSFKHLYEIFKDAMQKEVSMGVSGSMTLQMGPFSQEVPYTNWAIPAKLSYSLR